MLITTGKSPGRAARKLAKLLSLTIPFARVENRGKRSVSSLALKASKLRFSRLCSIHNERGKPSKLCFLRISREGKWEWLSPTIKITSLRLYNIQPKDFRSSSLRICGARAKELSRLISPANCPGRAGSRLLASSNKISVFAMGKKILEIGAEYE